MTIRLRDGRTLEQTAERRARLSRSSGSRKNSCAAKFSRMCASNECCRRPLPTGRGKPSRRIETWSTMSRRSASCSLPAALREVQVSMTGSAYTAGSCSSSGRSRMRPVISRGRTTPASRSSCRPTSISTGARLDCWPQRSSTRTRCSRCRGVWLPTSSAAVRSRRSGFFSLRRRWPGLRRANRSRRFCSGVRRRESPAR